MSAPARLEIHPDGDRCESCDGSGVRMVGLYPPRTEVCPDCIEGIGNTWGCAACGQHQEVGVPAAGTDPIGDPVCEACWSGDLSSVDRCASCHRTIGTARGCVSSLTLCDHGWICDYCDCKACSDVAR